MRWLHEYRQGLNKEDRDALDAEAARIIGRMVKVMDPEDGEDVSSNFLRCCVLCCSTVCRT